MSSNNKTNTFIQSDGTGVFISTARKMLENMNTIEDPVVRYALFFQFIKFVSECAATYLIKKNSERINDLNFELELESLLVDTTNFQQNNDNSQKEKLIKQIKLKRELQNLTIVQEDAEFLLKNLSTYLDGFNKWIYQPVYSPDHPCGKLMMQEQKDEFDLKVKEEKLDSKVKE